MNKLQLARRKEPLSDSDKKLITRGTMIRLCFEGKESFHAVVQNGTLAKVDDGNSNFYSAGVKFGQEIRFKSENILGIV